MINKIRFKIIVRKSNKIPEFYTIFARKMPDYIIRQRDKGQAKAKCLMSRPKFWPRGHFGLEDLTLLPIGQGQGRDLSMLRAQYLESGLSYGRSVINAINRKWKFEHGNAFLPRDAH